ncbi:MAG: sugar phosphate isomerase/epimerase [Planctomycetes bacterium]|nr:sugar phosphate isomerase/epimerase [Planctomycetota bacterium]
MHTQSLDRRGFLGVAAGLAGSSLLAASPLAGAVRGLVPPPKPLFGISLAQWSLHRTLRKGKLDNLGFPKKAKSFGIDAIEYVNSFFKDKAKDKKYIAELKQRCADEGVQSLLIMCDGEGALGAKDEARRKQAVENHHKWVVAAKELGCHSIRVNAQSQGSYDEQQKLAADGLRRLCEFADAHGIYVIVENHGGLSSNGKWLSDVLKKVDHPRVGSLPDFGNFRIGKDKQYDRYQGVDELMPFAQGVSAKSHEFDDEGNEKHTDYDRMLDIVVRKHGWRGHIGIEFEGRGAEDVGIEKTKALLERVRARLTKQLGQAEQKGGK